MNTTTNNSTAGAGPNSALLSPSILDGLRAVAPGIAFSVTRRLDHYVSWDGDGADPRDEGFSPYDVTVSASAIAGGEVVTGESHLGGCYYRPNEPIGDVHGYLPQMLSEALSKLQDTIGYTADVQAAESFLALTA